MGANERRHGCAHAECAGPRGCSLETDPKHGSLETGRKRAGKTTRQHAGFGKKAICRQRSCAGERESTRRLPRRPRWDSGKKINVARSGLLVREERKLAD